MDRYAVFVDAGYFFSAGAQAAFGNQTPRKQIILKSPEALLSALHARTSEVVNSLPLLRTYWYDAMPGTRLSAEQYALAMLPGIKLRLGALNSAGEQKGVDSLIVTDLIDLARNRAIADAVVVTGDEDLRIAVQVAQSFGVRVHILAAGDPSNNVSPSLQMEADSVTTLDAAWFSNHLKLDSTKREIKTDIPAQAVDATMPNALATAANTVIRKMLEGIGSEKLAQLAQYFSTQKDVPPEHDRPLIAQVSAALSGRELSGKERRSIREMFTQVVRDKSSGGEVSQ